MPQTFWFCTGQRSNNSTTRTWRGHFMQSCKNIYNKWGKIVSNKSQAVTESRWKVTKRLFTQDLNKVTAKVRIYKTRRNNSSRENFPIDLRGKILHEPTDIYNVIITWRFPDQSRPRWQQKGVISHLRDCQSSSLWLLEGRLVRGEQSRCTSAAARWPPCALQPRWCCQVEAPCQTLHREELFLKPSSRCTTGGDLGAVLGWGSLHQTGRLWGMNADLKINKQIRGVYIRVPNFQKGARKLDKRGHVFPQNCRHLRVNEESHKE